MHFFCVCPVNAHACTGRFSIKNCIFHSNVTCLRRYITHLCIIIIRRRPSPFSVCVLRTRPLQRDQDRFAVMQSHRIEFTVAFVSTFIFYFFLLTVYLRWPISDDVQVLGVASSESLYRPQERSSRAGGILGNADNQTRINDLQSSYFVTNISLLIACTSHSFPWLFYFIIFCFYIIILEHRKNRKNK